MDTYPINNLEYYMFDDIITLYPGFKKDHKIFTETIEYYDIDDKEYEYARFKNNSWKTTNNFKKTYTRFISKKWFDNKLS